MDNQPQEGKLAAAVEAAASELLEEVEREDTNPIEDYLTMLLTCPPAAAAQQTVTLLGLSCIGEYLHPDDDIQSAIRHNFAEMRGSWSVSLAELFAAIPLGWATSEIEWAKNSDAWSLASLAAIHPKSHTFRGQKGQLVDVFYRSPDEDEVPIPYEKVIHIINRRDLAFGNPYGLASCKLASNVWKAWKVVMAELIVAGKRQATPLMVGQADSGTTVPLLDANGNPLKDRDGNPITVPATQKLLEQLENIDNRSVLATDIKNKIQAINHTTDGRFLMELIKFLQRLLLLSFLVPETAFEVGQGGLGNAGLAQAHLGLLGQSVGQIANQIKEELIEKIVRPLIYWNYGEQESYGSFAEPERGESDRVALLQAISMAALNGGFNDADLAVSNRMRQLAGIPEITDIAPVSQNARYVWG